ncbi:MAG: DNA polymerase/3'-5' exonuclease PolX [Candidatus Nanohaloarchaea archaeon]|nr:DNA polymerase/3'-5' exonuclease PolX [Candidatus Nanohaloarchaea archaeon]
MKNKAVARLLYEIADFLEMQDVEYKPRAYRRAARSVETLTDPIEDYHAEDRLQDIDGVGDAIADKIAEYLDTGRLEYYEELKEEVPVDVEALTAVEGLGPKRVKQLYDALGITDLDDLEEAAENGDIADVDGFGEKSQASILDHIGLAREGQERMLLGDVVPMVQELEEQLAATEAFDRAEVVGSFRRRKPTIGDLDVLATAPDRDAAMDAFCGLDDVTEVLSRGDTKSSIVLDDAVQVDLRIVEPSSWGAAILYFTGSKDHNVALRKRAQQRGWTLNEYGLREAGDSGERVAGRTEEEIYAAFDMAFIPPELRENTGELDAAENDGLPELVETGEVRGDLQMHTEWSDGHASIREMAEAAAERGHDYILVTDHGPSIAVTDGITSVEELEEQRAAIEAVNNAVDVEVLQGMEADITADGLDISRAMVDAVDLVVASIHNVPDDPTDAVLQAFADGADIWGHPTNRKIHEREPVDLDLDRVMAAAAEHGVAVEINAQPDRLDLDWQHVKQYRDTVDFVVSTDAHRPQELGFMDLGVWQARRGWLEQDDVLNTRPLDELQDWFS